LLAVFDVVVLVVRVLVVVEPVHVVVCVVVYDGAAL
jgi:hypothetical protein